MVLELLRNAGGRRIKRHELAAALVLDWRAREVRELADAERVVRGAIAVLRLHGHMICDDGTGFYITMSRTVANLAARRIETAAISMLRGAAALRGRSLRRELEMLHADAWTAERKPGAEQATAEPAPGA